MLERGPSSVVCGSWKMAWCMGPYDMAGWEASRAWTGRSLQRFNMSSKEHNLAFHSWVYVMYVCMCVCVYVCMCVHV